MANRRATEPRTCPCGAEFYPWIRSGVPTGDYCSNPCKTKYGAWRWKFGRKAKVAS